MTDAAQQRLEALDPLIKETEANNPSCEQAQANQVAQDKDASAEQGAKDWGMLMYTIGGLVQMIAPELKPIYSEDRCLTWGSHMHQVGEKYGWNGPSGMPEIALAAASVSFVLPTFFIVRMKLQQMREAKNSIWGQLFGWMRGKGTPVPDVAPKA